MRTAARIAGGGGASSSCGVAQVGRQVLQVRRRRGARERLVVLEQREVARVLLEVLPQPRAVQQLQAQLLRARLRQ
jgi:hypothetical protein